jgi:hypothetical protein
VQEPHGPDPLARFLPSHPGHHGIARHPQQEDSSVQKERGHTEGVHGEAGTIWTVHRDIWEVTVVPILIAERVVLHLTWTRQDEKSVDSRRRWLTPVIPATQEAEMRRMAVRSQPQQIVLKTLSRKTHHKKGLVEWLKVCRP